MVLPVVVRVSNVIQLLGHFRLDTAPPSGGPHHPCSYGSHGHVRTANRLMARKKILIVDDSDSICSGIASFLELNGYEALTAYDGEQGVRLAKDSQPDAIVLDIMM